MTNQLWTHEPSPESWTPSPDRWSRCTELWREFMNAETKIPDIAPCITQYPRDPDAWQRLYLPPPPP